jgi:hypothetical protein
MYNITIGLFECSTQSIAFNFENTLLAVIQTDENKISKIQIVQLPKPFESNFKFMSQKIKTEFKSIPIKFTSEFVLSIFYTYCGDYCTFEIDKEKNTFKKNNSFINLLKNDTV